MDIDPTRAAYIIVGVSSAGLLSLVLATAVADWVAGLFGAKVEDEV